MPEAPGLLNPDQIDKDARLTGGFFVPVGPPSRWTHLHTFKPFGRRHCGHWPRPHRPYASQILMDPRSIFRRMLWLFAHWPERLFTRNTRFHPRRSIMGGWIS